VFLLIYSQFVYIEFLCVFSLVCFVLSVPVQVIAGNKTRLQNDLLSIKRDVKLYSLTIKYSNICTVLGRVLGRAFSHYTTKSMNGKPKRTSQSWRIIWKAWVY